jgi:cytidylate kinase
MTSSQSSSDAIKKVVVTLDGPSGTGKSSTARGVAKRLGLRYLDTGAQFRALTLWMLEHGVDVNDPEQVSAKAADALLESGTNPQNATIRLDGRDVSRQIRSQQVTDSVSAVAAVASIRERLLQMQREIIASGGIVVDGRDIGSVVWPQAEVKLYLTADPSARARRRSREAGGDLAATEADLRRRDQYDSGRKTAPLVIPEGSLHLDTTEFTLSEVIDQVVAIVEEAVVAQT